MTYLIRPDISKKVEELPDHPYSFPLDPFQEHAISAISKDENVLVCAKTGSGKTLIGEYQIYHSLNKGKRVFYTTPIKSLSNQKFNDLKCMFKDASVGIMTGDIKFRPDAQIIIMTTEILRNLLYKKGTSTENIGLTSSISIDNVDAVIFDECHYINDKDRGKIWEETMILLPPEINLVMLSATLDHPEYFANWLGTLKQKPIHLIETKYRIVPLTHNVLDSEYNLVQIMDANDKYYDKVYDEWYKEYFNLEDEKKSYQKKVKNARQSGYEGAVDGKVRTYSFVHKMNETIKMLEKNELLPALFFVLSRKQCELYANKVQGSLLSSYEGASVKNIISFHLHRHMNDLEKVPQYHTIHDLLCRGIAFHHSGVIPLLKEIIEILFSKGLIKVMFCTETFAVGLNMPTKTVLFTGFKKYDDQMDSMRMLRNDEYIQMAGRAGRRGKDDKGIVIHLPDREPADPYEVRKMMTGSRPPITSRMDFHYDFILKTMQSSEKDTPLKWLEIMEDSYWFQQRRNQIKSIKLDIENCKKNNIVIDEPYFSGCDTRWKLEQKVKESTNATRKEYQRQLDIVKSKHLGPKWVHAWANYLKYTLNLKEYTHLTDELVYLESHQRNIEPVVNFLYKVGYIKHNDALKLTNEDLTLKGILATEINEGHQILMTELYLNDCFNTLSGEEIVTLIACFIEQKSNEDIPCIDELNVSNAVKDIYKKLNRISHDFKVIEDNSVYSNSDYWNISPQMLEPMKLWIEGTNASIICQEYGLFEGNLIRSILKISNMLDEIISIATYCQHVDQINKLTCVKEKIIRDIVILDSLYLHL